MGNWWEESDVCNRYKDSFDDHGDKYRIKYENVGQCRFMGVEEHGDKQSALFAFSDSILKNAHPENPELVDLCTNVVLIPLSDLNKLFDEMQKEK
jgi:hypothetical protein